MVGLMGCAEARNNQSAGNHFEDSRTAERGYAQNTDQGIEDSRTAERVRETLAAGPDYKYDTVSVRVRNGVVQLSGFVNASDQRNSAGELASKVVGVSRIENNLTVKD
jgi:osmotically-inducible protein OsmY